MDAELDVEISGRLAQPGVALSPRMLAVAGMFGVMPARGGEARLFDAIRLTIRAGDVVLITGPSGAGKSTILRGIRRALEAHAGAGRRMRVFVPEEERLPADAALVDCFDAPLEESLRWLSRAGLAEAGLMMVPPAALSTGQQWRYRLARFYASGAEALVSDEFGAALDELTARVLAWQLGRHIRRPRAKWRAAVLATSRGGLERDLQPTVIIRQELGEQPRIERIAR
jgi:ABC-type ATPase with predicted acetyltransferase domain